MWKIGDSGELRYLGGGSPVTRRAGQDATAEGDHPPAPVGDREHEPIAEAVVGPPPRAPSHDESDG